MYGALTIFYHLRHPGKNEIMLLSKGNSIGPIVPELLGTSILTWVTKARLLAFTDGQRLGWIPHVLETKKNFADKLNLLKRSRFLPRDVWKEFYFKVTLTAVKYGLVPWGSCSNSDIFGSIERLHCKVIRIIFDLPKDITSSDVLRYD